MTYHASTPCLRSLSLMSGLLAMGCAHQEAASSRRQAKGVYEALNHTEALQLVAELGADADSMASRPFESWVYVAFTEAFEELWPCIQVKAAAVSGNEQLKFLVDLADLSFDDATHGATAERSFSCKPRTRRQRLQASLVASLRRSQAADEGFVVFPKPRLQDEHGQRSFDLPRLGVRRFHYEDPGDARIKDTQAIYVQPRCIPATPNHRTAISNLVKTQIVPLGYALTDVMLLDGERLPERQFCHDARGQLKLLDYFAVENRATTLRAKLLE